MTTDNVEAMMEELRALDREIEAAALAGDAEGFVRLQMRRAALPYHIREAKVAPIRREIGRLEDELAALEDEARRAREEPEPRSRRGCVARRRRRCSRTPESATSPTG